MLFTTSVLQPFCFFIQLWFLQFSLLSFCLQPQTLAQAATDIDWSLAAAAAAAAASHRSLDHTYNKVMITAQLRGRIIMILNDDDDAAAALVSQRRKNYCCMLEFGPLTLLLYSTLLYSTLLLLLQRHSKQVSETQLMMLVARGWLCTVCDHHMIIRIINITQDR